MTENNDKQSWQEKMGKFAKNDENSPQNDEKTAENDENSGNRELSNEEILQEKLDKSEQKVAELNDKLLRNLAEIDNVRRRSREEIEKTGKYAVSGLISDLVVVAENFFLACENLPQNTIETCPQTKSFVDAVVMTKKELLKIFEKNQAKRIYPLGEKFDHNFHEAIAHIDADADEGIVVQVMQAGYSLGDRLIRPALVTVSKGK